MRPSMRSWAVRGAALALMGLAPAFPALADTLVLDGDDVTDWAHVRDSQAWKQHDACLVPDALLKFDLGDIGVVQQILGARLDLYAERAGANDGIQLWHVQDDSWSYGLTSSDALWSWPTWHSIGTVALNDSGAFSVDVTAHVLEEHQAANRTLSLKITTAAGLGARLGSPLAPLQRMRPRLVVEFVPVPTFAPLPPDLAVSTQDVRFTPMRPAPGQAVTLRADVRNLGPAPASNVGVAFWDGAPGSGTLIGNVTLPAIGPGGGSATAAVSWNAVRGLREIHVVADPGGTILESDESNNQDFRSFLVTDPAGYVQHVESFEHPGLRGWDTDFEFPRQPVGFGPRSFYLNRSGAEAYHGHHALEMFLDGTGDDGTLWIERAFPVEPNSTVEVQLAFEFFRYGPDLAFTPVAYAGVLDPEVEGDFQWVGGQPQAGWELITRAWTISTGPFDQVFVAAGITIGWETPGTFYLDLVRTQVTTQPTEVPRGERVVASALLQNRPNPMGPLTTIAYRLARDGPVSLRIHDLSGRVVALVRDGVETAGWHEAHWNGADDAGQPVPSGVYFYRLVAAGRDESRRLLLER